MKQKAYELRLLVNGKPIHEYDHKGRTFVEGRKGSPFEVEFKNNSSGRVLVIPSVDGVSTLDGQPATPDSKGFLVKPFQTLVIPGWAVDSQNAAKFVFQDKERSYAAHASTTGTTNAGVIGILVYQEKVEREYRAPPVRVDIPTPVTPWPTVPHPLPPIQPYFGSPTGQPPSWMGSIGHATVLPPSFGTEAPKNMVGGAASLSTTRASITSNASAQSLSDSTEESPFGLGTGWGQKVDFKTNEVQFNKGDLDAQLAIYYDTRRNLEKRGIEVVRRERTYLDELPSPFQGVGCKPPPGWKG